MSIADYNQDAILLLNINGRLFIDTNDAVIRNCRSFIKKISKLFKDTYLLSLSGYGDADMINIYCVCKFKKNNMYHNQTMKSNCHIQESV